MGTNTTDLDRLLREQQVILETASTGISFIQRRVILRCNQRFAEIYGYGSPASLVGTSSLNLYTSEAAFETLGEAAYPELAAGRAYKTRTRMRRQDGTHFWCSLTGKVIDPSDPDAGSVWIVEDIDDLVLAEQALQAVMHEQALILEHALVGIVFLKNRRVTHCNSLFASQFGYTPEELQGQTSRQWYLTEADWLEAGRQCYEPLLRGDTFRSEMLLAKKDGSPLWCDVLAKAIDPLDMEKGSIWITMDITARKAAETALAQAHADLENQVALRTRELNETVNSLHLEMAERRQVEEQVRQMALHDTLTGLPNRRSMDLILTRTLAEAKTRGDQVAVMFLDLDRFKHVNDAYGHAVGDSLLQEVALRLRHTLSSQAVLSRQGGDEFVVVLPHLTHKAAVLQCVRQIGNALRRPIQLDNRETKASCSVGISLFPDDGLTPEALLKHADMAMYQAKEKGRGHHQFFNAKLEVELQQRIALEQALHQAVPQCAFELHYQPQVDISSGQVIGVEALLRWHRPGLGWEPPSSFVPVAEEVGLIHALGAWVLEQACLQTVAWHEQGLGPLRVAVNVSAMQLEQAGFGDTVLQTLKRVGLPAHQLEIEITESVMVRGLDQTLRTLEQLHAAGVSVSIDDFGTGYSSLSYLTRLPLDKLKIDRSFVQGIEHRETDAVLCKTMVAMATNLGLAVTAEGVETPVQLRLLTQFGCNHYQGYLFSRPVPAPDITSLLQAQHRQHES